MPTPKDSDLVARCEAAGVAQVELQFADISGALKSVAVPLRRLTDVLRAGEWFDGSALEGAARELESDMFLHPDPASLAVAATEPPTARLICDVVTPDGKPYPGDSRSTLKRVLGEAAEAGLDYRVGPEVEFFLFHDTGDGMRPLEDPSSYFERGGGRVREVELEIVAAVEQYGIAVESSHHEVASGQYELDLPLQPALAAADALTALKPAVKELARRRGLQATFMPKPLTDAAGSGMHTHQVLYGAKGQNLFADKRLLMASPKVARRFAAGQPRARPGMCALVAPLVNSYKRLVPGYEAPVAGSWGRHNRSALIRVPHGAAADTRLELRLPDPSCNPYLAFTAMLAAGLDGLERELELGPPMEEVEHGYQDESRLVARPLPGSLGEALAALEADDVLTETLGGVVLDLSARPSAWSGARTGARSPWGAGGLPARLLRPPQGSGFLTYVLPNLNSFFTSRG